MNLDLNMYVHLTSRLKGIKAEAIRKLSNQSQNNFKRIASFFTFFEDEINSKEKVVMGRAQENKVRKL